MLISDYQYFSPEIACLPPQLPNGNFRPMQSQYKFEDAIEIYCNAGYKSSGPISKCTESGWSPPPWCKRKYLASCLGCEYPDIENGRLEDYYESRRINNIPVTLGQSVDFSCNTGFLSARRHHWDRVQCTTLGWYPEPKCLIPCTASEEDMGRNNIKLRWKSDTKLYSESGDTIEFTCIHDFSLAQGSPPFRAQCRDGTITYPRCRYSAIEPH
uniref:Sushi domain-containing protein n=1 Tax=Varanus komodoensis TaxID=61221 RepID=A0A8D2LPE9_VARKO